MSETQSRTNPIIVVAAVAVILFSGVGIGVMTGVIPSSRSTETPLQAPEAKTSPAPSAKAQALGAHNPSHPAAAHKPAAEKAPVQMAANEPPKTIAPRVCLECGTISSVNVTAKKGEGSGIGVVAGGVVGGLVGNQIGSGRGNTAATVVGAAGGAFAGNEVEKRIKTTKQYNVAVRMDDGSDKTFTFDKEPGFAVGEKVRVLDGKLVKS
jgi:outer membrane lipoprotein SlyB